MAAALDGRDALGAMRLSPLPRVLVIHFDGAWLGPRIHDRGLSHHGREPDVKRGRCHFHVHRLGEHRDPPRLLRPRIAA